MNRPNLSALGVWLLVTAALALALTSLVPSNAELARRAEAVLGDALGVPVTVRTLRWRLFPAPRLVIDGIATVQPQPIRFIRLTLFAGLPRSGDDWRGGVGLLRIARAELDGAEVPPQSLRGLGQADADEAGGAAAPLRWAATPLERLVFRDVNWDAGSAQDLRYEGEIDFDALWRPRNVQLRRAGDPPAAAMQLTRRGELDQWDVSFALGQGSGNGHVRLHALGSPVAGAHQRFRLEGALQLHQIDAGVVARAFGQPPVLAGQVSSQTDWWSEGATPGELARQLQTRSTFEVIEARLLRFDLDQAMRRFGRSTVGETSLGPLTGQLATHHTAQGVALTLRALKTDVYGNAGPMAVTGRMPVSPVRRLDAQFDARFVLELLAGLQGQSLQVSRPLDQLTVTLPQAGLGKSGQLGRMGKLADSVPAY